MKNILIVLALVTVFAFAANAQSKDCCKKEKCDTTKVEKTTTTTSKDGKETVGKEVACNKIDMKENCGEKSSCCDVSKEKKTEKVEKEVEKK